MSKLTTEDLKTTIDKEMDAIRAELSRINVVAELERVSLHARVDDLAVLIDDEINRRLKENNDGIQRRTD